MRSQSEPLVKLSEDVREEHAELMKFLRERVYRHHKVLRMTSKARRVLKSLFEAFFDDIDLMPSDYLRAGARCRTASARRMGARGS